MKAERILLFEEQSLVYKGWLINIEKKSFWLNRKFHIQLFVPENLRSEVETTQQSNYKIEIQKNIKWRWIDLLGNSKRMLDECYEEVKQYIDTYLGDVDSYLRKLRD